MQSFCLFNDFSAPTFEFDKQATIIHEEYSNKTCKREIGVVSLFLSPLFGYLCGDDNKNNFTLTSASLLTFLYDTEIPLTRKQLTYAYIGNRATDVNTAFTKYAYFHKVFSITPFTRDAEEIITSSKLNQKSFLRNMILDVNVNAKKYDLYVFDARNFADNVELLSIIAIGQMLAYFSSRANILLIFGNCFCELMRDTQSAFYSIIKVFIMRFASVRLYYSNIDGSVYIFGKSRINSTAKFKSAMTKYINELHDLCASINCGPVNQLSEFIRDIEAENKTREEYKKGLHNILAEAKGQDALRLARGFMNARCDYNSFSAKWQEIYDRN